MTMLIAGHETTAAVLTWAVFLLAQVCTREFLHGLPKKLIIVQFQHSLLNLQNPAKIRKAQAEIDAVLGEGAPTYESMKKLEYVNSKKSSFIFLLVST